MPDDTRPQLSTPATQTPDKGGTRKRLFAIFGALLAAIAVGIGLWNWLVASNYATTDNAYVGGDVAQITPQIAASVIAVAVADTTPVKANDVLVTLDDSDARIAVTKAEADLASAINHVRQISATSHALKADIANREATVHRADAGVVQARSALDKAQIDLRRREDLASSGAVSAEELTTARNAFTAAQAALNSAKADLEQANAAVETAQAQLDANDALLAGLSIDDNPDVRSARSRLDQAKLDLSRTVIRAPFDGVVAQRHVQIGQRVKVGDALMTVVPVGQLYVDANFKESQLAKVRAGQTVELTSDLYGNGVVFHGKVVGFAGGTGSSMAIIPAQNATGNWIKVVQRLPVRITLDPEELAKHPLRIGLSMDTSVSLRADH